MVNVLSNVKDNSRMCGKQKRESGSKTCNPLTILEFTMGWN